MKALLWLVALAGGAAAQTANQTAVYQTLLSSVAGATASSPVRNIGQGQHIAEVAGANAPGKTCIASVADMGFEGSFDGANWRSIGVALAGWLPASSGGQDRVYVRGDGVFPYVRFNVRSFDTVNCRFSVRYSGSLYPLTVESGSEDSLFIETVQKKTFFHSTAAAIQPITYTPAGAPGLNDVTASGTLNYGGLVDVQFCFYVDSAGATDTFAWGVGGRNGCSATRATGVAMTGAAQLLDYGISITWAATTGHSVFDAWRFFVNGAQTAVLSADPSNRIAVLYGVVSCPGAQTVALAPELGAYTQATGPAYLAAGIPLVIPASGWPWLITPVNRGVSFFANNAGPCQGTIFYRLQRP